MKKYLITGVAGFIASAVARVLLNEGHDVVGLDNLNDAYDVRMKEYRLRLLSQEKGFTFLEIDIEEKDAVLALGQYGPFDAVINLAARAGVRVSVENPWVYLATNTLGTLNLLELCRRQNINKFLLASTSSIYGNCQTFPTPETTSSDLPLQPYAATKKGAEVLAHSYHYLYDIDVTVVRFFTVYGPAGRPDMSIMRFIHWIYEGKELMLNGDGSQTRGFTYVDDIARGVIAGLKPVGYEIFNLGGHEVISIKGLITLMEEIIGKQANIVRHPMPKADIKANNADTAKAQHMLDWHPEIDLKTGLTKTLSWYLAEREWVSRLNYV